MVTKLTQIWVYRDDLKDLKTVIKELYLKKTKRNPNEKISNAVLINECVQTIIHNMELLE